MTETKTFMIEIKTNFQNPAVAMRNLKVQMGQIANMLTRRQQGTFPSKIEVNPKEQSNAM